ncbi:hypothetical protein BaRGS_00005972 [Batillaria attramentaria]|uniref:Uncharacterized protein n=1 Tax=Batillaria attramentaria TaxID=370345 RepID=A0ABD0LUW5_9CAEN
MSRRESNVRWTLTAPDALLAPGEASQMVVSTRGREVMMCFTCYPLSPASVVHPTAMATWVKQRGHIDRKLGVVMNGCGSDIFGAYTAHLHHHHHFHVFGVNNFEAPPTMTDNEVSDDFGTPSRRRDQT